MPEANAPEVTPQTPKPWSLIPYTPAPLPTVLPTRAKELLEAFEISKYPALPLSLVPKTPFPFTEYPWTAL